MLTGDPVRHRLGLSREALRQLHSLIAERGRNSWQVGDQLVAIYGPPGLGPHDGSTGRLDALADELGCSRSWLAATRTCAAAWPLRERRPTIAFAVHRALCADPQRIRTLHDFVEACERQQVTPSAARLTDFLDTSESTHGASIRSPRLGRPRLDPVDKLERQALRLDHDALARLVERLAAALALTTAA